MRVDALAVHLRPRAPMEAADLGVRICQRHARSVYLSYAMAILPVAGVAIASYSVAAWVPFAVIWWAKPWLDRTILFALSRAAFGQSTAPADVWQAQREVWWTQWLWTVSVRRLSPWRALTQPTYQLEGLSFRDARVRARQIRQRTAGAAMMVTHAFYAAECALIAALISLVFWFAPAGRTPSLLAVLSGDVPGPLSVALALAYGMTVAFLEPLYVGAGFAMYLNRRTELEAWDIEQEFRHAFAD